MSAVKSLTSRVISRNTLRSFSTKPSSIHRSIVPSSRILCGPQSHSSFLPKSDHRSFTATSTFRKGLSPESEDPQPKEAEKQHSIYSTTPAELSDEHYHQLADEYLNALVEKLEGMQEQSEEVDVEYSAGVLTLALPPNGTYVLNKQPPNKQIWLSSPISGPKRYDYVMLSEGQDSKEGTGQGEWVYLRDETSLTDLLAEECGVVVNAKLDPKLED